MAYFRIVGAVLVLLSATAIGYSASRQYYHQLSLLNELRRGMELVRCQMHYTLYSVPKLLAMTGKQLNGCGKEYFIHLSEAIENGVPRHKAHEVALSKTEGMIIPKDGLMALIEWSHALGQFDVDGEERMMNLSIERMEKAATSYREEKNRMAKSYLVLGLSAGIALIILIL